MCHHAQLIFVFLVEMGFHHLGQAVLELLTSGDPLASASQSAGITGVSHCTQPGLCFRLKTQNPKREYREKEVEKRSEERNCGCSALYFLCFPPRLLIPPLTSTAKTCMHVCVCACTHTHTHRHTHTHLQPRSWCQSSPSNHQSIPSLFSLKDSIKKTRSAKGPGTVIHAYNPKTLGG